METIKEVKLVEWFDSHWYKIVYQDKEIVDGPDITTYFASTTTKLGIVSKPFLARWRGDIGNREADLRLFEAQERGIRIHHGWYTLTTGGVVIYQPFQRPNYNEEEISRLMDAYAGNVAIIRYQDEMYDLWKLQRWIDVVKPKFLASEMTVYSLTNKDAGTLDNLVFIEEGDYMINGAKPLHLPCGIYLLDLKTGKQVDDNAFMQTADYFMCVKEMGLGDSVGTLILHTQAATKKAIEGLSTLYRSKEQVEEDYKDYRLAAALWERKNADAKPNVFEFPSLLTLKKENENE